MSDSWDERRKAQEDSYFEKVNQAALERMAKRSAQGARLSPVNGKPMEHITIMGVVVERCTESGGLWLDAGELEEILKHAASEAHPLSGFFSAALNKK